MTQLNKAMHLLTWMLRVVLGIVLLGAMLYVSLFYAAMPFNTLSLWRIKRALMSSVVHPTDSRVTERRSFLGSRYINSSECTFVAGEFRSTSLSRQEVMAAYEEAAVHIFGFARRMPVHVIIADDDTRLPLDETADDWLSDFAERVDTRSHNITHYLVYLYEKGRSPLGDDRCFEWSTSV